MDRVQRLRLLYQKFRFDIKRRVADFERTKNSSNERIFAELAFCLCTPQSKATVCWQAINKLYHSKILFTGSSNQILKFLKGIRFKEVKAKRIIKAREKFGNNDKLEIKKYFRLGNEYYLRDYFAKEVEGLGYKEASHFLRNVGIAKNLAILDIHIINSLVELGVIKSKPKTLTKKKYLEIERAMQKFAKKIRIPMVELDLLLWAKQTGFVFK
jgi:N-glycosylase/DNA lyase